MDADNFHSEGNITKMKQGTPLTDEVYAINIITLQILSIAIKVKLVIQIIFSHLCTVILHEVLSCIVTDHLRSGFNIGEFLREIFFVMILGQTALAPGFAQSY